MNIIPWLLIITYVAYSVNGASTIKLTLPGDVEPDKGGDNNIGTTTEDNDIGIDEGIEGGEDGSPAEQNETIIDEDGIDEGRPSAEENGTLIDEDGIDEGGPSSEENGTLIYEDGIDEGRPSASEQNETGIDEDGIDEGIPSGEMDGPDENIIFPTELPDNYDFIPELHDETGGRPSEDLEFVTPPGVEPGDNGETENEDYVDEGGIPGPVDEMEFRKYRKRICDAVPAFTNQAIGGHSSVSDYSYYDYTPYPEEIKEPELYELAFMNMAYGFTSDTVLSFLPDSLQWMKKILDLISLITKTSCHEEVVPSMYLNSAKNLFLYYLFKRGMTSPPSSGGGDYLNYTAHRYSKIESWMEITNMLEDCSKRVTSLKINIVCNQATHVTMKDGASLLIKPPMEKFDVDMQERLEEFTDEIIDAVWWMFSTTYARCYALNYPKEAWVLTFLEEFRLEFLEALTTRWLHPGKLAEHFPLVMGAFDLRIAKRNLRFCSGAAYIYEDIGDRQLVRPVTVAVGNRAVKNFKTGVFLM